MKGRSGKLGACALYCESINRSIHMNMRRTIWATSVLFSVFVLTGCTTSEVRQEKDIDDNLNFSDMKNAEAEKELASKTPPPQTSPSSAPSSVTNKKMYSTPPAMMIDSTKRYAATLETTAGPITVALSAEEMPITVNNFVFLAKEKFYDGTIFHRTIKSFMIQGGDPTGTGMGGPGYKFNDEKFTGKYTRGTVAMANSGLNTNGSQFFIMHADVQLPADYVIFGQVIKGLDVVDIIATAPVKPGGEGSSPVAPITVTAVSITEK